MPKVLIAVLVLGFYLITSGKVYAGSVIPANPINCTCASGYVIDPSGTCPNTECVPPGTTREQCSSVAIPTGDGCPTNKSCYLVDPNTVSGGNEPSYYYCYTSGEAGDYQNLLNSLSSGGSTTGGSTGGGCDSDSVPTAIGCVPTKPEALIPALITFSTRAAGGIALLIMAFSAVQMILARGDQNVLSAAKDRFRDAAIGLVIMILAVLILQIIGINILNIPGFR